MYVLVLAYFWTVVCYIAAVISFICGAIRVGDEGFNWRTRLYFGLVPVLGSLGAMLNVYVATNWAEVVG